MCMGPVIWQDMIGRRYRSVLFFVFIPHGILAKSFCKTEYLGFQCQSAIAEGLKGNQVQVLNDPVTVNGETAATPLRIA